MGWRTFAIALAVIVVPLSVKSAEAPLELAVPKSVQVAILAAPNRAVAKKLQSVPPFDIDPNGRPVIGAGSTLKALGSTKPLLALNVPLIEDFAWMRDGALLIITQNHLAGLRSTGVELSLALPGVGMRIRPAGRNTAYVFGGEKEPANHSVYLFARDGTVTKLATLPSPVSAVAGDGITTYIASGQSVIRVAWKQPVTAVLRAGDRVGSLEIAPEGGLFYSTASSVGYIAADGSAYEFLRGQGGTLRCRGSSLFLFIADGLHVLRFAPVEGFGKLVSGHE